MAGLLEDKVVVISGVGPALGTTLARRCAEDGADLVLAARTVERLDDVAKQVTDLGRRAVSVGTDITDDGQVDNLVEQTLDAYGKVDVLINNAFRVPSMKPLANTTFEHIRETIELTVLGALRLIQGFTPALAEAKGSVVNVNSMVMRHSDPKYGAYKMAKAALLAMSQSLASELGPQGIRVNSVLPGLYLGRHAAGLLRAPGRQVRHHRRRDLQGGRGQQRSQAAAHRGRGGLGDPVHGQRSVQRHHRPDPRRELRGVHKPDGAHRSSVPSRPARLGGQGHRAGRLRCRRRQLPRSAECAARVVSPRRRSDRARQQDVSGSSCEMRWWPGWCPRRPGSSTRSTSTSPIERPIFVTGLPRTGTTALHRLLCGDPRHQGLELWLAEFPQPRPPRETWSDNPVFQQLDAQFSQGARRESGLHRAALHDRRRGGGVLAAVASVAALGVLRDAGARADLLAVAGSTGLDASPMRGTARTCS